MQRGPTAGASNIASHIPNQATAALNTQSKPNTPASQPSTTAAVPICAPVAQPPSAPAIQFGTVGPNPSGIPPNFAKDIPRTQSAPPTLKEQEAASHVQHAYIPDKASVPTSRIPISHNATTASPGGPLNGPPSGQPPSHGSGQPPSHAHHPPQHSRPPYSQQYPVPNGMPPHVSGASVTYYPPPPGSQSGHSPQQLVQLGHPAPPRGGANPPPPNQLQPGYPMMPNQQSQYTPSQGSHSMQPGPSMSHYGPGASQPPLPHSGAPLLSGASPAVAVPKPKAKIVIVDPKTGAAPEWLDQKPPSQPPHSPSSSLPQQPILSQPPNAIPTSAPIVTRQRNPVTITQPPPNTRGYGQGPPPPPPISPSGATSYPMMHPQNIAPSSRQGNVVTMVPPPPASGPPGFSMPPQRGPPQMMHQPLPGPMQVSSLGVSFVPMAAGSAPGLIARQQPPPPPLLSSPSILPQPPPTTIVTSPRHKPHQHPYHHQQQQQQQQQQQHQHHQQQQQQHHQQHQYQQQQQHHQQQQQQQWWPSFPSPLLCLCGLT
mmetsp:Transcript_34027/g.55129  ORF Transcript_34027/g.55129 Transcript_34027/m.55129 type:complete len:541 (-) Transcript_34027:208-1830(-)